MSKEKVVVALLLVFGWAAFAASDGWNLFKSSTGFSISYPGTWVRSGASTDRLYIRSSKGGAEGIGIKHGQAEITAMEAPESSEQTLHQVIAYYTRDTTIISQQDVPEEKVPKNCSDLREVVSKEPAIPPGDSPISVPMIINTDFFCEVEGHKVVILLRNWEGDKRQQEYRHIALQMARGVRMIRHRETH